MSEGSRIKVHTIPLLVHIFSFQYKMKKIIASLGERSQRIRSSFFTKQTKTNARGSILPAIFSTLETLRADREQLSRAYPK